MTQQASELSSNPSDFLTPLQLLADDAPLLALLSIRENPLLKDATPEQLNALVLKCRIIAATPAKQKTLLIDGAGGAPRKRAPKPNAQKQAQINKLANED